VGGDIDLDHIARLKHPDRPADGGLGAVVRNAGPRAVPLADLEDPTS
jgi:hypothetical protein